MGCPNTAIGPPGPVAAATVSATGTLKIEFNWLAKKTDLVGTPQDAARHKIEYTWENGNSANQIQEFYRERRTLLLTDLYEDIDLRNVLRSIFNQSVLFVTIRELVIRNRSTVAGDDLLIGGAGTDGNAFSAPFNGNAFTVWKVRASGMKAIAAPLDGFTVSQSSADILRVMHAGTSSSIAYDLIIGGTNS